MRPMPLKTAPNDSAKTAAFATSTALPAATAPNGGMPTSAGLCGGFERLMTCDLRLAVYDLRSGR